LNRHIVILKLRIAKSQQTFLVKEKRKKTIKKREDKRKKMDACNSRRKKWNGTGEFDCLCQIITEGHASQDPTDENKG
jgi:hypothetical protein